VTPASSTCIPRLLARLLARRRSPDSRARRLHHSGRYGQRGTGNYAGFLEHVIKPSPVRIVAYLNISFAGIFGFSKRIMIGESGDLRLMAPLDAVEAAEQNRDTLAGFKVRVGFNASGNSGIVPLDIARQAAEQVGNAHDGSHRRSSADAGGRAGAHAARRHPDPLFPGRFRTIPIARTEKYWTAVLDARRRGVLFDVGPWHGILLRSRRRASCSPMASWPDCISSDVHALCIDGPAFDLLTTCRNFVCHRNAAGRSDPGGD